MARRDVESPARKLAVALSVAAIAADLLVGCGAGAAKPAPSSRPSLAACVAGWNSAVLGKGRTAIRAIARVDRSALMARSADGVCALGFPLRAGYPDGRAAYVSLDSGAYTLGEGPVDGYGSKRPPVGGEAWIRDQAGSETNVVVDSHTGLVRATRTTMPTLPVMLLDYGAVCRRIYPPTTRLPEFVSGFEVVRSNTSCSWMRTLIFAYERHEGSVLGKSRSGAPVRSLARWRCAGSGTYPIQSLGEAQRLTLRCLRGREVFEARGTHGHIIGAPG